ncbi:hypothetical protein KDRO_B02440 [Kluyveromyces lactis]|nr:hypothetical protein KDRO_B02440 [Kluyveromyces lactis]
MIEMSSFGSKPEGSESGKISYNYEVDKTMIKTPSIKNHDVEDGEFEQYGDDTSLSYRDAFEESDEEGHQIKYKTSSWQHITGLMLSEYIILAMMSFPWSYSVLGLIPGLILTVFVAGVVLYTSFIILDYCEKFPHLKNACDIGQHLFWGSNFAWYATAVCYVANNTLIQGVHVLVGGKYLNTITNHSTCTVAFGVITAIISFVFSIPRTFASMSKVAYFSAITMFISVILAIIFVAIQDHPVDYDGTNLTFSLWPQKGTSYVDAMGAFLNIVYVFAAQVTYPQFISEMKKPRDFKKVFLIVTAIEVVIYSITGAVMYYYIGNEYMTTPAYGSLTRKYKIIAYSFAVPTIIFVGSLYSNITTRFIFFKVFKNSEHMHSHTTVGWLSWIGIIVVTWIVAFIVAEVIPFFSDLLSLMCSLFACWFGFVFWGMAYLRVKQTKYKKTNPYPCLDKGEKIRFYIAGFLILFGVYILGPGLYATVQSIIYNFQANAYGTVFSCADNSI